MPEDNIDIIHFWQTAAMTLFGILTTIGAFWFGIMRHLVKKDDIIELIELHSPYLQDRENIMTRLDAAKDMQSQFASALQKNTEVMSELKIQIAVLGKTLQNLESRIEKEI
jgi:hypothetical protein